MINWSAVELVCEKDWQKHKEDDTGTAIEWGLKVKKDKCKLKKEDKSQDDENCKEMLPEGSIINCTDTTIQVALDVNPKFGAGGSRAKTLKKTSTEKTLEAQLSWGLRREILNWFFLYCKNM